ncbi:hypothetical protein ABVK25_011747 [Lepraria finkii]|uniref:Uncharacterized protein n=1 Tax=Lepraria finkii TaxID=1340010 RepID=A0ABR4APC2_9LECA
MKEQVIILVQGFKAISAVVDIVVKSYTNPFLDTLKSQGGTDSPKIGGYTPIDMQRSNILNAILTIRSYIGVFSDIPEMWSALSVETVMPRLMMCDQLSIMGYAREDASDIKRNQISCNNLLRCH